MSLCPWKLLLCTNVVLCTHMKSNFIAHSVLDFLCHLFPFLDLSGRLALTVSVKAHLMIFRKLEQCWQPWNMFSFSHLWQTLSNSFTYANTTFLISFYQTQNITCSNFSGAMSVLQVLDYCGSGSWLVGPFKGLMILENFLWKAPSDAFCNFATF